jgi:hypothetical protein
VREDGGAHEAGDAAQQNAGRDQRGISAEAASGSGRNVRHGAIR